MRKGIKRFVVCLLLLSIILIMPSEAKTESTLNDVSYGMAAFLTTCFYSPAKLVYATTGAITGGFAYLLTGANAEVANKIWTPSLGGTYVITPGMLKGKEAIQFIGKAEGVE